MVDVFAWYYARWKALDMKESRQYLVALVTLCNTRYAAHHT